MDKFISIDWHAEGAEEAAIETWKNQDMADVSSLFEDFYIHIDGKNKEIQVISDEWLEAFVKIEATNLPDINIILLINKLFSLGNWLLH